MPSPAVTKTTAVQPGASPAGVLLGEPLLTTPRGLELDVCVDFGPEVFGVALAAEHRGASGSGPFGAEHARDGCGHALPTGSLLTQGSDVNPRSDLASTAGASQRDEDTIPRGST